MPIICQGPPGEKFRYGNVFEAKKQEGIKYAKDELNYLAVWAKENWVLPEQILISDYGTISAQGPDHKIDDTELNSFLEIIKANNWHRSFTYGSYETEKFQIK